MRKSAAHRCPEKPDSLSTYNAVITLGLAPGGIIKAWAWNECYRSVPVARTQAEIQPLGPHLGKGNGHYHRQTEASKKYIERFGIPYGSW